MIQTKCGSCGKAYRLPEAAAGKKAKCKACGHVMAVPAAEESSMPGGEGISLDALAALGDGQDVDGPPDGGTALGFDPTVSMKTPRPKMPLGLLLGIGGGAVVLLVIGVIVAVLLTGGGDEDEQQSRNTDNNTTPANNDADAASGGIADSPFAHLGPDNLPEPTDKPDTDPDTDADAELAELAELADPDGTTGPDADAPGDADTPTGDADDDNGTDDDPVSNDDPADDLTEQPEEQPAPQDDVEDLPGYARPTNSDYAIALPPDYEVISQTRVALRTRPMADGRWLSMEVHRLSGLDRRAAAPVDAEGDTVLMRGRRVPIPEGAVLSELSSDAFTIHRLLYPEPDGDGPREVAYVMKDGPYLITVRGRFVPGEADQLEALDAAAKSVTRSAG